MCCKGLNVFKFVNDLNSPVEYSHFELTKGAANVYRTNRLCATDGFASIVRISQMRSTVSRQLQSKEFLMFGPVPDYGFCVTYLQGKPAGHRILLSGNGATALSYGHSEQGFPKYPGPCQRKQGLAHLRRLCSSVDWDCPQSLSQRRLRGTTEANSLCIRFHHHRPMSFTLSLGTVSEKQSCHQTSYPAESAWQYSGIHSHYQRKGARRQHSGLTYNRTRFFLCYRSWLSRFQTTLRHPPVWRILCNSVQTEPCSTAQIFPTSGQNHRSTVRPNYSSYRYQQYQRLPRTTAAHFLLRYRYQQASCLSDQQLYLASPYHRFSVQSPVVGRTIFQVDKTAPANQCFLRYFRERRKDSGLDRCLRVRADSHPEETPPHRPESLHNSTGLEHQSIRERTAPVLAFATIRRFFKERRLQPVDFIQLITGQ